jgi:hypothetical protein
MNNHITVTASQLCWYRNQGRIIRIVSKVGRRYTVEVSEVSL